MSSLELRLETRHFDVVSRVELGIEYILKNFGEAGLDKIPEDVDIAMGARCALRFASGMLYCQARNELLLSNYCEKALGFLGTQEQLPLLTAE